MRAEIFRTHTSGIPPADAVAQGADSNAALRLDRLGRGGGARAERVKCLGHGIAGRRILFLTSREAPPQAATGRWWPRSRRSCA